MRLIGELQGDLAAEALGGACFDRGLTRVVVQVLRQQQGLDRIHSNIDAAAGLVDEGQVRASALCFRCMPLSTPVVRTNFSPSRTITLQANLAKAVGYQQKNNTIRRNVFLVGVIVTILGCLLVYQRYKSNNHGSVPLSIESVVCVVIGFGMMVWSCTNGKKCCPCC